MGAAARRRRPATNVNVTVALPPWLGAVSGDLVVQQLLGSHGKRELPAVLVSQTGWSPSLSFIVPRLETGTVVTVTRRSMLNTVDAHKSDDEIANVQLRTKADFLPSVNSKTD